MEKLYNEAKMAWGACMPQPLKRLQNRDDEHVLDALRDVMHDVMSDTWTVDAKIAWSLITTGHVV